MEFTLQFGALNVVFSGMTDRYSEAKRIYKQPIKDGTVLERSRWFIDAQYGNPYVIEDYELLPQVACLGRNNINSQWLCIGNRNSGDQRISSFTWAAGRKGDMINHGVGFVIHKKLGEHVNIVDGLAMVYTRDIANIPIVIIRFRNAYT